MAERLSATGNDPLVFPSLEQSFGEPNLIRSPEDGARGRMNRLDEQRLKGAVEALRRLAESPVGRAEPAPIGVGRQKRDPAALPGSAPVPGAEQDEARGRWSSLRVETQTLGDGKVEELERRLRRRTVLLGGALALSAALASGFALVPLRGVDTPLAFPGEALPVRQAGVSEVPAITRTERPAQPTGLERQLDLARQEIAGLQSTRQSLEAELVQRARALEQAQQASEAALSRARTVAEGEAAESRRRLEVAERELADARDERAKLRADVAQREQALAETRSRLEGVTQLQEAAARRDTATRAELEQRTARAQGQIDALQKLSADARSERDAAVEAAAERERQLAGQDAALRAAEARTAGLAAALQAAQDRERRLVQARDDVAARAEAGERALAELRARLGEAQHGPTLEHQPGTQRASSATDPEADRAAPTTGRPEESAVAAKTGAGSREAPVAVDSGATHAQPSRASGDVLHMLEAKEDLGPVGARQTSGFAPGPQRSGAPRAADGGQAAPRAVDGPAAGVEIGALRAALAATRRRVEEPTAVGSR